MDLKDRCFHRIKKTLDFFDFRSFELNIQKIIRNPIFQILNLSFNKGILTIKYIEICKIINIYSKHIVFLVRECP